MSYFMVKPNIILLSKTITENAKLIVEIQA